MMGLFAYGSQQRLTLSEQAVVFVFSSFHGFDMLRAGRERVFLLRLWSIRVAGVIGD
jgi:hypothetical protein